MNKSLADDVFFLGRTFLLFGVSFDMEEMRIGGRRSLSSAIGRSRQIGFLIWAVNGDETGFFS